MGKNALIIFAHQESERSFNGSMKDAAVERLSKQGFNVVVSDLYKQNFQPQATKADFTGPLKNPEKFNYDLEASHAYLTGTLCNEVTSEIEKVKVADLIIFQAPMYWSSIPAIMKGWFDRVFIQEFAFKFPFNTYENGLLKGKRVVLSITTGGVEPMYTPIGINGDINVILWPILNMILRFTGLEVLRAHVSYIGMADEAKGESMLKSWSNRVDSIMTEEPIKFISSKYFDPQLGFCLCEEFINKENDNEKAPSVGQHMNKRIDNILVFKE